MAAGGQRVDEWLKALPDAGDLLFWPPPAELYTVERLYRGFSPADPMSWRRSWDTRVYDWTLGPDGRPRSLGPAETVATRLHDSAMDALVRDYIDPRRCVTVGVMGGHGVPRTGPAYARVARLARTLRRQGIKIVTGGGPGLMEAANFGAFLAPHTDDQFDRALDTLRGAPDFGPGMAGSGQLKADWIAAAARARQDLLGRWDAPAKDGGDSLGVPTWYYGDEPPNLFAAVSGKYFMNSLREDGLVSIANGGLVFAEGAAGTVQEVFQNANYNYYRGAGVEATPMVFLGADFWNPGAAPGAAADRLRKPVFPLIEKLAGEADPPFTASVLLSDDADEIARFLLSRGALETRRADLRLARVNSLHGPRRP